ncbi:Crp/Fnr family transcriptional regulator [Streptomyces sp. ODS28]|uniref:Crp/Fnr family transcriptional regulator n=1 Tax=Streptomyces sp. ODS28 TaxID=3136688 RepID=UPI0031F02041
MRTSTGFLGALPDDHQARLKAVAKDVGFPSGTRIFEEGEPADRFWVIRTGAVTLDMKVPGHRLLSQVPIAIESVGPGQLLGWSWLFPPYVCRLGAETVSPVRALEFDAETVRVLCDEDHRLGHALTLSVAQIIGHRLQASRVRLLDTCAPPTAAPR